MPWRRQMAICLPQSLSARTHFFGRADILGGGHFGWDFFLGSGMILGWVRRFKVKLTSPMDTPEHLGEFLLLVLVDVLFHKLLLLFSQSCCPLRFLLGVTALIILGFFPLRQWQRGQYQSPLLEQMESHSHNQRTCFLFLAVECFDLLGQKIPAR